MRFLPLLGGAAETMRAGVVPGLLLAGAISAGSVEIRIGEIDSLSGVLAAQGTAVHEGVVYAVSEVNARGGILGSSVKLVTRDEGN